MDKKASKFEFRLIFTFIYGHNIEFALCTIVYTDLEEMEIINFDLLSMYSYSGTDVPVCPI